MKAVHTALLLGAIALALPLHAHADDVFEATVSFSAVAQGDDGGPVIDKFKVTTDGLLNVARGRSPDSAVPPNEFLALVVDCQTRDARLSVVDATGPTELVTVAESSDVEIASDSRGGVIVAELDVVDGGNASNGLDGGYLVAAGKFKLGAGDCPVGLKASVSGVLDVTITDDGGTESFAALVTKGKLAAGSEAVATLP